ncbi:hypothetical protein [Burkholderia sp. 22PA0106]|uniref:hypothetical protein n=1 Tax=Burkholderia sp. 22PA0106 TaxID=3237371 RepID=UPI0039C09CCE
MSPAVFVIPSRVVVFPSIAGYLPPPYGTRRGALLSDFWWNASRSPGLPNAHVPGTWHGRAGVGWRLAASAFGTDNNAWTDVKPHRGRPVFRAIALACCQMLIGVLATVSMLSVLHSDSAAWYPMAWFNVHNSAQPVNPPSVAIRRALMQPVPQTIVNVPAPVAAHSQSAVHATHRASAVPKMPVAKPVARGTSKPTSKPMTRGVVHRPHPMRTPPVAATNDKPAPIHPAHQRGATPVAKHRPQSSIERVLANDDRVSDDAIRALRIEQVRQDAAARRHAAVAAYLPADAVFLLSNQVRLTEH